MNTLELINATIRSKRYTLLLKIVSVSILLLDGIIIWIGWHLENWNSCVCLNECNLQMQLPHITDSKYISLEWVLIANYRNQIQKLSND